MGEESLKTHGNDIVRRSKTLLHFFVTSSNFVFMNDTPPLINDVTKAEAALSNSNWDTDCDSLPTHRLLLNSTSACFL